MLFMFLCAALVSHAEDMAHMVKKAVERSTLNQPGTKPFHLKASSPPASNVINGPG
jgi:hypothetical protein